MQDTDGSFDKAVNTAVNEALKAARELGEHPNSPGHVKARTMALVRLVIACDATDHTSGGQTLAALALGCDRQLIHRHVTRALTRGWAIYDRRPKLLIVPEPPQQTEITDFCETETVILGAS